MCALLRKEKFYETKLKIKFLRAIQKDMRLDIKILSIERNRKNLTLKKCKANKYIDKRVKQV